MGVIEIRSEHGAHLVGRGLALEVQLFAGERAPFVLEDFPQVPRQVQTSADETLEIYARRGASGEGPRKRSRRFKILPAIS
jgi:hypothetical protein